MTRKSNCPVALEEWIFLDHNFDVFVGEVIINMFVYLLITNATFYENIVNLIEYKTERHKHRLH